MSRKGLEPTTAVSSSSSTLSGPSAEELRKSVKDLTEKFSKTEEKFKREKASLEERVSILQKEKKSLEEKVADFEKKAKTAPAATADVKDLEEKVANLQKEKKSLEEKVAELEEKAKAAPPVVTAADVKAFEDWLTMYGTAEQKASYNSALAAIVKAKAEAAEMKDGFAKMADSAKFLIS